MWTISICMNFPKYSIYLPSLMKQISQGHHGWRYAIAAKETEIDGVEEFLSEGITCSNTHTSSRIDWLQHEWESASRPSFFAPISYRTSMLYAMLKMTLLWQFMLYFIIHFNRTLRCYTWTFLYNIQIIQSGVMFNISKGCIIEFALRSEIIN